MTYHLAEAILLTLLPIFHSIRQTRGLLGGIGFLHPITDRVTISAHGCESHSWSRKIIQMQERKASLPALLAVTKENNHNLVNNNPQYSPGPDRKFSVPARALSSNGSWTSSPPISRKGSWMSLASPPVSRVGSSGQGFSTLPRVGKKECDKLIAWRFIYVHENFFT